MSPGSRFGRDRSAFTLIELMAVLVLVGLVSATAMLRFGATTHRAQFEWSLERVMAADRLLRTHSVTCGQPGHLEFEIGAGRLDRVFGAKRDAAPPVELGARNSGSRGSSPDSGTGKRAKLRSPIHRKAIPKHLRLKSRDQATSRPGSCLQG